MLSAFLDLIRHRQKRSMKKGFSAFSIILFLQFKIIELQYLANNADLENEYGKLIHVSVLFRHGNRSPYDSYPKDPHRTYPWPDGFGQLTKTGERYMYNVGKWYKQRYSNLVKQIRSHTNITVTSTDKDRAIMSAQCFLAGFYPTKQDQFLNKSLPWQPIPIHTTPLEYDHTLRVTNAKNPCPKIQYYQKKFYNRRSTKKLYDKHGETFRYLRNCTGFSFPRNDILQSVNEVDKVYDTLLVQSQNNFTLPSWTQKVFPRPLLTIKEDLAYKPAIFYRKVRRLTAGPFLASVISNMIEKSKNESTKIFHLYSSHDTTITYVSTALGFSNNTSPPYGSGLIFELRRKRKEHTVSIYFANSTTAAPYQLEIPHCKAPCTLKKFANFTRRLIPYDWDSECQLKKKTGL